MSGTSRLRLHVIASGSKGNAAVVEDALTGECVAIDCGVCARDFFGGCRDAGVDPARIRGILITHDHIDHTKGLGVVLRGFQRHGLQVPVFANGATVAASPVIAPLTCDFDFRDLEAGRALKLGGMDVLPFRTSHDAAFSCGFRVEAGGDALGYLTDSGVVTPEAHEALGRVRILALESNHDVRMLREGPYPYWLKQRIASARGHLSNVQAAEELDRLRWPGLEQVVAMHISENNNTYPLPVAVLSEVVGEDDGAPQVRSAFQRLGVSVE